MKLLAVLLLTVLVGCASRGPTNTVTYEELRTTRYTYKDCQQIDFHINNLEGQLRARGLLNVDPEELNESDRMYNATARVLIWNLRIDCNNRNRFKK